MLYAFFWVILRRLNFICRRFGTLCSIFICGYKGWLGLKILEYSHCMFIHDYPDWGFSVLFPYLQSKCQGKTRKDGARPPLFLIFVLFCVFFVLFNVFFCCSMYCLFCNVLCIVCVYMCTVLLPPGGYPIAVKYIISFIREKVWLRLFSSQTFSRINTPKFLNLVIFHTYPHMKVEQSVPKRRHIKFRLRGITQKKACNKNKLADFV
jgi:hypothetical protein